MGSEGRAGRRHGGKMQPGIDKHHCWMSTRESCYVTLEQTQAREPSCTMAHLADQQGDKRCLAGGSRFCQHQGCMPAASPHSQCQMMSTHHPPAPAQLSSAGTAARGCQGKSALNFCCTHGPGSRLMLEPGHAGVGQLWTAAEAPTRHTGTRARAQACQMQAAPSGP